jgi:4-hydroxy-tetrahydrodipicolinate synthase
MIANNVVFPIPPSYNSSDRLDTVQMKKYLDYLWNSGVKVVITTAGTSQYNLLSDSEVIFLNRFVLNNFQGVVIAGLPVLSERFLSERIAVMNTDCPEKDRLFLMLLYSERYYHDDDVIEFVERMSGISQFSMFVHAVPIRNGKGGEYCYDARMLNRLAEIPNVVGIKEESPTFEMALSVCLKIENKDFIIVAAGKSMSRFSHLHHAGVHTFLSGVGSIYPKVEIKYFEHMQDGELDKAEEIVKKWEEPFFNLTMGKIGYHIALRECLKIKGLGCEHNRKPFPNATEMEILELRAMLKHFDKLYVEEFGDE